MALLKISDSRSHPPLRLLAYRMNEAPTSHEFNNGDRRTIQCIRLCRIGF